MKIDRKQILANAEKRMEEAYVELVMAEVLNDETYIHRLSEAQSPEEAALTVQARGAVLSRYQLKETLDTDAIIQSITAKVAFRN